MQIFDSSATIARLPFPALITAIEQMFIADVTVPRRHHHVLNDTPPQAGSLLIMPAWQPGKYLGIKHVTIFPGNGAHGLQGLHSTYTLFDARYGMPVAVIDGDAITVRRTAAASALAARSLARADARRLLIVGTGKVAAALAPAYAAVRDIAEIDVWNIRPGSAVALAARLQDEGFQARAIDDLEAGVRRADIVSCATLSQAPLVRRAWLAPGVHVDLIGGFTPQMRESDDATFADTSVFVDTREALDKAGDVLSPIAAGVFAPEGVRATLEDLCRGVHPGRERDDEITVYKAVGTALEDLAAAILVYEAGAAST
jgi:ornithine cyclodeaminase/alanine dehydrogenase-like protein (mu-crystallin family)